MAHMPLIFFFFICIPLIIELTNLKIKCKVPHVFVRLAYMCVWDISEPGNTSRIKCNFHEYYGSCHGYLCHLI